MAGADVCSVCGLDVFHCHPIFSHDVLEKIFGHLEIWELKSARQACAIWNVVASKELVTRSVTKVRDRFLSNYKSINLGLSNLKFVSGEYLSYEIVQHFSTTLSTLHFPFTVGARRNEEAYLTELFDWDFYDSILNCCKVLKTLSIEFSIRYLNRNEEARRVDRRFFSETQETNEQRQYSNIKMFKLRLFDQAFPEDIAALFFKAMPSLQGIEIQPRVQQTLDGTMSAFSALGSKGIFKNLTAIELHGQLAINFCECHISNLIAMNLKSLQSLKIKGFNLRKRADNFIDDGQMSSALFYQLFSNIKNTLQQFSLSDCLVCRLPIFQFPVMKSLTKLEIYLPQLPDWYRLFSKTNIVTQFPKLKIFTAYQKYDNRPWDWEARIDYWNTYFLELLTGPNSLEIHTLQFKVHNHIETSVFKTLYQEIRNLFPTLRLLRTHIKGSLALSKLLQEMSNTNVEELYLTASCAITENRNKNVCCFENEFHYNSSESCILRWKKDIKTDLSQKFPELRILIITSEGCKKVNEMFLKKEGLMDLLKDARNLKTIEINN